MLDAVPGVTLLLVGPGPDDREVAPDDPRVRALGPLPNIAPQLAAADLLLDSWPVTGGTTVLDAAAAGLPVLALGDPPPDMVGAPLDLLDGAIARGRDTADVGARAAALLADPAERARLATCAAAVVEERHAEGWAAQMEAAVGAARAHAGSAAPPEPSCPAVAGRPQDRTVDRAPSEWEAVIHLARQGREQPCSPTQAYLWNSPELPPHRRPRTGAELDERFAELRSAAPTPPRLRAEPPIELAAISALLDDVRARVRAGEIAGVAIVVPPGRLDEAVAHVEAALAQGEDVDVELVAGDPALV